MDALLVLLFLSTSCGLGPRRCFAIVAIGIEPIVLARGDRRDVTETIIKGLPIDLGEADLTPEQKVLVVLS